MSNAPASDAITISFDASVFSVLAVKKAAYALSDVATAEIRFDGHKIHCELHATSGPAKSSPEELQAQFRLEVLDHDLRERIAEETAPLRNAILAHAFSGTGLQK